MTTDDRLARQVALRLSEDDMKRLDTLADSIPIASRNAIARAALTKRSIIFVVGNQKDAVELVNHIAPEHAQVLMAEPEHVSDKIVNAGAVFIGRYAPTVVGYYFAGPSNVLPTNRTARFFSPLGVTDFINRTSVIRYSGRAI